jgi:hypothetical protein
MHLAGHPPRPRRPVRGGYRRPALGIRADAIALQREMQRGVCAQAADATSVDIWHQICPNLLAIYW